MLLDGVPHRSCATVTDIQNERGMDSELMKTEWMNEQIWLDG